MVETEPVGGVTQKMFSDWLSGQKKRPKDEVKNVKYKKYSEVQQFLESQMVQVLYHKKLLMH